MSNTNCLEGFKCPKCGSEDLFRIAITAIAVVCDGGVDETYDHEWDDSSYCECCGCHHYATVAEFREVKPDERL